MSVAPAGMLETVVYADDLDAALAFYNGILELPVVTREPGRHVFFRCGKGMLLVFNPDATEKPPGRDALPVPPHGARGAGHACFRAGASEIAMWRERLVAAGVGIESEFEWPRGGRSIYVRDPAGNSIEFAEPRIWGLPQRRLQRASRIVVASHNAGKVREVAELMAPYEIPTAVATTYLSDFHGVTATLADPDLPAVPQHHAVDAYAQLPAVHRVLRHPGRTLDPVDLARVAPGDSSASPSAWRPRPPRRSYRPSSLP